ncbi:MAG TPA: M23 family metallopeptidase [Actinomycetota bacterium]|nr:M23 family metallopeptidase [Actinomycetota bacterium]
MRTAARTALALVVLLGGMLLVPAGKGIVQTAAAQIAQPTPTLPPILPGGGGEPEPSPSPTQTKPSGGGGGGGQQGGGGGKGEEEEKPDPDDPKKPGDRKGDRGDEDDPKKGSEDDKKRKNKKKKKDEDILPTPSIPGSFNTEKLLATAARLRSLGLPEDEVASKVFAPFIIGGYATWIDTWGAPRYGPGPIVRTHEGQDVFCDVGTPLLATEAGTIEFDDGGLGGRIARLYRSDGSYWYYAHLSDWNTEDFSSGDRVEVGDVIGYCGNSGNAITTPAHVHFGWYQPNGEAKNPMRMLVRWLREAQFRALGLEARTTTKRVKIADRLTFARQFGDAFAPDRSELEVSGESLWASGSSPATGAFALAEVALQEALAESTFAFGRVPAELADLGAGTDAEGILEPHSRLAEILDLHGHGPRETGD